MKKLFLMLLTVAGIAVSAEEIAVPLQWKRPRAAGKFQIAEAGAFRDTGKYVLAFQIGKLPELVKQRGTVLIYWNSDNDKNTGRFSGKTGIDIQCNINCAAGTVKLYFWKDNKTSVTPNPAGKARVIISGDMLYLVLDRALISAADTSSMLLFVNDATGRLDSVLCEINFGKTTPLMPEKLNFDGFSAKR